MIILLFLFLPFQKAYSFRSRSFRCDNRDCSVRTHTSIFRESILYRIELFLTSDNQNIDEDATKAAQEAGLFPYIIPETYDDINCLNQNMSTRFQTTVNSWNFSFFGECKRRYCYKVIPNININIDTSSTKLCFLIQPGVFLTSDENVTVFGRVIDPNDMQSFLNNEEIPEIDRVFNQPTNPEFSIVHYRQQFSYPISSSKGLIYSPDHYHNIYYISPNFPFLRNVWETLEDVFLTQYEYDVLTSNSFKKHEFSYYYSPTSFYSGPGNYSLSYDQNTNRDLIYAYYSTNHSLYIDGPLISQIQILNDEIDADSYSICGGIILFSNYYKTSIVLLSILYNNISNEYHISKHYQDEDDPENFSYYEKLEYPHYVLNQTAKYPYPRGWNVNTSDYYYEDIGTKDEYMLQPTSITGVHLFGQKYCQWSMIYGNFLAVSNTFARTYFIIMTLGNGEKIEKIFASNETSRFALLTTNHMIYYGDTYSNIVERVPYELVDGLNITTALILFNSDEVLELVDVNDPKNPIHHQFPPESIPMSTNWCPYRKVTYELYDIDYFTRVRQPVSDSSFPPQIYVDHSDTFHFAIHATYQGKVPNLLFAAPFYFTLNYSKKIDYSHSMITYNFWIKDALTFEDFVNSGNQYIGRTERIDFFFENSSSVCLNFHTFFDITSGCLPGLSLQYEFEDKKKFFNGEDMEFLQFSRYWVPQFYLYDSTRDMKIPYTGLIEISIIGYGTTESKFKLNNDPEFNTGKNNRVFGYTSDILATAAIAENCTIEWLCQVGSVCNRVSPKFPNPPVYYLKLRARTIPRDLPNSTYCTLEKEFYLEISGIPMDAGTMATILIVTIILLFIILRILYHYSDRMSFMKD